jgi:hypothetical protein
MTLTYNLIKIHTFCEHPKLLKLSLKKKNYSNYKVKVANLSFILKYTYMVESIVVNVLIK